MAACRAALIVLTAVVVCSCSLRWAEAETDCTTSLAGLQGCFAFLTNASTTPDQKTCCAPLETVLSTPTSFQCLCAQATNTGSSQAFKNALLLPQSCKLSINVSEANCTQSPPTSTTTPASSASNSPGTGSPSAGIMSASPLSAVLVLALLWSIVTFLV